MINANLILKQENLKVSHSFKVGDKVILDYSEEDLNSMNILQSHIDSIKSKTAYTVVSCGRDCDGEILYTLSLIPFKIEENLLLAQSFNKYFIGDNKIKTVDEYILSSEFMKSIVLDGMPESNLISNLED